MLNDNKAYILTFVFYSHDSSGEFVHSNTFEKIYDTLEELKQAYSEYGDSIGTEFFVSGSSVGFLESIQYSPYLVKISPKLLFPD